MANLYNTYEEEVFALAKSLIIKFNYQNHLVNERLKELGVFVEDDPRTWKYNLNLAGVYHSNDRPMTIISNDTQEEIAFTKEALVNHPRTKADYRQRNDEYWTALVEKYPVNQILAKSITREIELNDVLAAKDFQILDWDSSLVADNETNLIPDLQKWLYAYAKTHWNRDFAVSDPGYPKVFVGAMAGHIVQAILNIRKGYAHTDQASQFHIWTFLAGHYEMDKYRDILSPEQAMWLYKNIRYVRNHAGRKDTFETLIKNLVDNSGLKIANVSLVYDDNNYESTREREGKFLKRSIDGREEEEVESINTFMEKMIPLAIDNEYLVDHDRDWLADVSKFQNVIESKTGIVEISQDDTIIRYTLENYDLRWRYLIYLSSQGFYDPDFVISLPNGRTRVLKTRDAMLLWLFSKSNLDDIERLLVPTVLVNDIIPRAYASFDSLRAAMPDEISDDDINNMLSHHIDISTVATKNDFEEMVAALLDLELTQEYLWEGKTTDTSRALMEGLAHAMWANYECLLAAPGTTFNDWLKTVQINRYDFTDAEWNEIGNSVVNAMTGKDIEGEGLPLAQLALVNILDELTSYTLRFVTGETAGSVIHMEIPAMFFSLDSITVRPILEFPVGQDFELMSDISDIEDPLLPVYPEGLFQTEVTLDFIDTPNDIVTIDPDNTVTTDVGINDVEYLIPEAILIIKKD